MNAKTAKEPPAASGPDLLGLGASTVDVLARVERLPVEDENMRALEISVQGGGPVATAIVTAARLGARTAMLDLLGDDWRGRLIRDEFQREGVDVSGICFAGGASSPTSTILVKEGSGARSIVWAPGEAPELSPDDLPVAWIESARILHVNGRHWRACLQAVGLARAAGVQVSFDGGAGRYRPELRELVPLVDVCIVAREFAARYTGEPDPQRAAAALLRAGPGLVVVTAGTQGSWVFPRDGQGFHQPAYLLEKAVDTTGCGDSYHGAFLFARLQGYDLKRAASFASAVAAINSGRLGGRAGLPRFEQVQSFLAARGA